jgi:hypothetical protein
MPEACKSLQTMYWFGQPGNTHAHTHTHTQIRSQKRVVDLKADVAAATNETEVEKKRTAARLMAFEAEIDRLKQGVSAACGACFLWCEVLLLSLLLWTYPSVQGMDELEQGAIVIDGLFWSLYLGSAVVGAKWYEAEWRESNGTQYWTSNLKGSKEQSVCICWISQGQIVEQLVICRDTTSIDSTPRTNVRVEQFLSIGNHSVPVYRAICSSYSGHSHNLCCRWPSSRPRWRHTQAWHGSYKQTWHRHKHKHRRHK